MNKLFMLLPLSLFLFQGCTYNMASSVSSAYLGDQMEISKNYELVVGKARQYYLFPFYGLFPIGKDSIETAIEDALVGVPGHTLVNVFMDKNITFIPSPAFPLIYYTETSIVGTPVKIKGRKVRYAIIQSGENSRVENDKIPFDYKVLFALPSGKWNSFWKKQSAQSREQIYQHALSKGSLEKEEKQWSTVNKFKFISKVSGTERDLIMWIMKKKLAIVNFD